MDQDEEEEEDEEDEEEEEEEEERTEGSQAGRSLPALLTRPPPLDSLCMQAPPLRQLERYPGRVPPSLLSLLCALISAIFTW